MKIENKLSLITGGSSGIGLALAKKLAGQGANVWILARDPARLDRACQEIMAVRRDPGQQVGTVCADVANLEQINRVLQEFISNTGIPDLLINSAGIARTG